MCKILSLRLMGRVRTKFAAVDIYPVLSMRYITIHKETHQVIVGNNRALEDVTACACAVRIERPAGITPLDRPLQPTPCNRTRPATREPGEPARFFFCPGIFYPRN